MRISRVHVTGLLMAALVALVLAGCGQKGPLYLPDHTKKATVPASSPGTAQPTTTTTTPASPDASVPSSPDSGPAPPH